MDIENVINEIVDSGNVEHMHNLSDILEDTLEIIQEYDEECYKKYEMELYKMAYGTKLSRELAEEIVHKMKPYGERWNIDETNNMQNQYELNNIRPIDFYVVINSAFNDYRDLFGDETNKYIEYTVRFIEDEDAKPDKVFLYFTTIPD